jgi:sucrose phosphorylase
MTDRRGFVNGFLKKHSYGGHGMPVRNQVHLITYPDSLGGTLATLDDLLGTRFHGLFPGGVHILPPFPSSGDRGFAPLTYDEIEPAFGTWDDVRRVNERAPVMLDLMVNHMSRQAAPVQDFLEKGVHSAYADLFITPEKVWTGGTPPTADLEKIFLRRGSPFSRYRLGDGEGVSLWTTFGKQDPSEQIDLDWRSPAYRLFVTDVLDALRSRGIGLLRLDAVGYVVKKAGTSCFFVEPEMWEYLAWIRGLADARGIEILPEVHARSGIQESLSVHGYWIYDFVLPYRILEGLVIGDPTALRQYLARRPDRQFTLLDCHDGIPVKPDLDGLYDPERVRRVADVCRERGANFSRIVSASHKDFDGFDVHQIHCSFYSALGEDDDMYVAARALQLFAPGVPQVYYAGLLAGKNDGEATRRTGEGREINRHNFEVAEIDSAMGRPVVQRLVHLIRLRNEHPAFRADFRLLSAGANQVRAEWRGAGGACTLTVDFSTRTSVIESARDGRPAVREEV